MIGMVNGERETEREGEKGSQSHQKVQKGREQIPRKKLEALVELLNAEADDFLCGHYLKRLLSTSPACWEIYRGPRTCYLLSDSRHPSKSTQI